MVTFRTGWLTVLRGRYRHRPRRLMGRRVTRHWTVHDRGEPLSVMVTYRGSDGYDGE
jgi:hypothetical protein